MDSGQKIVMITKTKALYYFKTKPIEHIFNVLDVDVLNLYLVDYEPPGWWKY